VITRLSSAATRKVEMYVLVSGFHNCSAALSQSISATVQPLTVLKLDKTTVHLAAHQNPTPAALEIKPPLADSRLEIPPSVYVGILSHRRPFSQRIYTNTCRRH
jgi:hypothetical protein